MNTCRNGHDVDAVGIYMNPDKNGRPYRTCRECRRAATARYRSGLYRGERALAKEAFIDENNHMDVMGYGYQTKLKALAAAFDLKPASVERRLTRYGLK